ncbi:MAG TPA: hypothetical protein VLH38_01685 [Patescibacteria group bacterium]|nr:hypothetical protein [Patescibacteria group bacterium]
MRIVRSSIWLALLLAGISVTTAHATQAPATGGIMLSPATATLSLAAGHAQEQARFTITNKYSTPISVHLDFDQTVTTPGAANSATKQLSVSPNDLTLMAGATATPTITLTDSAALAPGSQQVNLILTQQTTSGMNVSVIPSIRMPLIIIKQSGAITDFAISRLVYPHFALKLPKELSFTMSNTGNVIATPRGYVTIQDPRGRIVNKGVLNTASTALAPRSKLALQPPLTMLSHAWLPGDYQVAISYSIGGDAVAKIVTSHFFYLPLWQPLLLLLIGAIVYCAWQIWREYRQGNIADAEKSTS